MELDVAERRHDRDRSTRSTPATRGAGLCSHGFDETSRPAADVQNGMTTRRAAHGVGRCAAWRDRATPSPRERAAPGVPIGRAAGARCTRRRSSCGYGPASGAESDTRGRSREQRTNVNRPGLPVRSSTPLREEVRAMRARRRLRSIATGSKAGPSRRRASPGRGQPMGSVQRGASLRNTPMRAGAAVVPQLVRRTRTRTPPLPQRPDGVESPLPPPGS